MLTEKNKKRAKKTSSAKSTNDSKNIKNSKGAKKIKETGKATGIKKGKVATNPKAKDLKNKDVNEFKAANVSIKSSKAENIKANGIKKYGTKTLNTKDSNRNNSSKETLDKGNSNSKSSTTKAKETKATVVSKAARTDDYKQNVSGPLLRKNELEKNYSHIKGWGVDINLKNDPTYPIKFRTDEEQEGYSWERPTQQVIKEEILHSNERPNLSTVFGTSVPPSGLSGMLRRYAFKHSESSYGHWLPLVMADRIGIVEGIFHDIFSGHIPNIIKERGWSRMDFKYNKKRVIKKVVLAAVLTSAVVFLISKKRNK